ncbi:MAG: precorrin-4 C(11)-methyltransferase [Muribaculaceae bacterium]|nr:precorrin-4 C(11)-methyltransferase [Muribaculaceae bacterium]
MSADNIIIHVTDHGAVTARRILTDLFGQDATIVRRTAVDPDILLRAKNIIFVGAMGICVRTILPVVADKHTDPAVVCVDSSGHYAIPVLSGHIGGANDLARRIAATLGGEAVVTTQSDTLDLWALDTLAAQNGWLTEATPAQMNSAVFKFVDTQPTALLLDIRDAGTTRLEATLPTHVTLIKDISEAQGYKLLIAVTPRIYTVPATQVLHFHPRVLNLGVGCRRNCDPTGVASHILNAITDMSLSPLSLRTINTIDIKKDEPLLQALSRALPECEVNVYTAAELSAISVPNPSVRVTEATGSPSVAEASAICASQGGPLLVEKQKCRLNEGADFTFAVALDLDKTTGGHIEIVGAGPGDPDLISVKGRRFLEQADLILYAGSLVPRALTACAKPGCTVQSSAGMNLEEQFELMKQFYDRGCLVVRLHTGDPCIYGAIQEQMAFFDRHGMSYHITPGISSFQAAAAELRSQFTIPEKVQSIILTRGEGRTPMPPCEKLSQLARSRSTMCIYLSADIVEDVQAQLLEHYPPETPVAACYKLTWPEQRIYRGQLSQLAELVRQNHLTLTTLLVVGDAIDNRLGLSRLYDKTFTHLFRKGQ